jgi:hypothetical protein
MKLKRTYLLLCVGAILMCCCTDDPVIIDRGEDYFPLEVGRVLEYKVDSIIFDDAGATNKLDTFSSFVRERVLDKIADLEGDTVFRIQREHRGMPDDPWQVTDIWTAASDGVEAQRVEENQRLVKMVFPLYKAREWNPTKYINTLIMIPVGTETINMFSFWEGEVSSIHLPEQIGAFAFDSVMTCFQADDDVNILERRFVLEKYAKGIGLVFRSDTIVDSRCKRLSGASCVGLNWMQKGEKGYIMQMELINHN